MLIACPLGCSWFDLSCFRDVAICAWRAYGFQHLHRPPQSELMLLLLRALHTSPEEAASPSFVTDHDCTILSKTGPFWGSAMSLVATCSPRTFSTWCRSCSMVSGWSWVTAPLTPSTAPRTSTSTVRVGRGSCAPRLISLGSLTPVSARSPVTLLTLTEARATSISRGKSPGREGAQRGKCNSADTTHLEQLRVELRITGAPDRGGRGNPVQRCQRNEPIRSFWSLGWTDRIASFPWCGQKRRADSRGERFPWDPSEIANLERSQHTSMVG